MGKHRKKRRRGGDGTRTHESGNRRQQRQSTGSTTTPASSSSRSAATAAVDWFNSYDDAGVFFQQLDIARLVDDAGGIVLLKDFLPPHVAKGALAMLESIDEAKWNLTADAAAINDDNKNNNNNNNNSSSSGGGSGNSNNNKTNTNNKGSNDDTDKTVTPDEYAGAAAANVAHQFYSSKTGAAGLESMFRALSQVRRAALCDVISY
jgi:hypothetical protein